LPYALYKVNFPYQSVNAQKTGIVFGKAANQKPEISSAARDQYSENLSLLCI
jgi:hypothetical protein